MGRLTKINEDACDLCKSWVLCKDKNCLSYKVYKKLAHYEDLEEAGRLIEVVYGFNQYDHNSAFECSVCEFSDWDTLTSDDGQYNYCPKCGAKMVSKAKLKELEG